MSMEITRNPFDVRDGIPDADLHDEPVQGVYDAINRMVVLIGNIPFKELFLMPIRQLAAIAKPQVRLAAEFGLLLGRDTVEKLIDDLVATAGSATVGEFYVKSRDQVAPETLLTLRRLRRHGVRIPLPVSDRTNQEARQAALTELLEADPDRTFLSLFQQLAPSSSRARKAVRQARQMGLLGWFSNDLCCSKQEDDESCFECPGGWCVVTDMGICTDASTPCPGKRPNPCPPSP